jgi:hypothetical protein
MISFMRSFALRAQDFACGLRRPQNGSSSTPPPGTILTAIPELVLKSRIVLRTLRVFGVIGIDGRRQLAVTAYCLRTFFDASLMETGVSRITISPQLYPEIQVLE